MLERLAQVEHQQQQEHHQNQDEDKNLSSCGLTVHFTARLLQGRRQCILSQRHKLNKETTPFRWIRRDPDTNSNIQRGKSFLVEEDITEIEKDLLRKWIRTALYWWLYDSTEKFEFRYDDLTDWSSIIQISGLYYEPGSDREASIIKLIMEELRCQQELGHLEPLF